MGFINVFIGSECDIRVKNNKLIVTEENQFPLEDINCVMADNLKTSITLYALNELTKAGAAVIICDEKHMPSSLITTQAGYFKRLSVLKAQAEISKPRKKGLWKQIVIRKIENQAKCLRIYGKEREALKLEDISKTVASNDSDNREAESARLYFTALFGKGFTRTSESNINGALNYGYAIVRSLIARQLAARGFECAYGIFHRSELNAFNLADDIMEPFRPTVDALVYKLCMQGSLENKFNKREIFSVVDADMKINGGRYTLSRAAEITAESLLSYFKGESDKLNMPLCIEITQHSYE